MIFDRSGSVVSSDQREHEQHYPGQGLVEHDATEIWQRTQECVAGALKKAKLKAEQLSAVGVTNQRETTLVWRKSTGEPYHNAIVWNDVRTADIAKELEGGKGPDRFRSKTGLPLATYFSATKLLWLIRNVPGLEEDLKKGEALFGTIDTWLLYNLTGGTNGGIHVTSVCNASRTLMMNLKTLQWDETLLKSLGIPKACLPEIKSNSEVYGHGAKGGYLEGVPIAGILGDQQAAMFGQACFSPGEVKSTYGTGNFIMMNTGTEPKPSKNGLLTTVGYKLGEKEECVYALEGAVATCGSAVQWLRDQLKIIMDAPQSQILAESVPDNGGMYFVPAFSGLFAPRWDSSARGVFCGLTAYNSKAHFCRATLEAVAYQAREVIDAMGQDSGVTLSRIKVDGGMTANDLVMQFQADIIDTPVTRPVVPETTALGAAYAAGLAVGVWKDLEEIRAQWKMDKQWTSKMGNKEREKYWNGWNKAVSKSVGWEGPSTSHSSSSGGLGTLGWFAATVVVGAAAATAGWMMGKGKRIKILGGKITIE
ncbi:hypothetical protein TrCOL_g4382 [Triparma columacea]|nr:hypothetical protein TrCOL_g4382 [Triparma columacea]